VKGTEVSPVVDVSTVTVFGFIIITGVVVVAVEL